MQLNNLFSYSNINLLIHGCLKIVNRANKCGFCEGQNLEKVLQNFTSCSNLIYFHEYQNT